MTGQSIGIYGVSNRYVWNIISLAEELGLSSVLVANSPVEHSTGPFGAISPDSLTHHHRSIPFFPGVVRPHSKKYVVKEAEELGLSFGDSLISAHAAIGSNVHLGRANIIRPMTVIDPHCSLGDHVTLSPGVTIGHHVTVGAFSHLANGVTISGDVQVGKEAFVGVGALIRDGVSIGDNAIIGMGAVVVKDVPAHATVIGNPARPKA